MLIRNFLVSMPSCSFAEPFSAFSVRCFPKERHLSPGGPQLRCATFPSGAATFKGGVLL